MSERITTQYNRLLEVRILHHYWLDNGETTFDLINNKEQKDRILLNYNAHVLFNINPTNQTIVLLKSIKAFYRKTQLGFFITIPSEISLPSDTVIAFYLTIADAQLPNYTALTLRPQTLTTTQHTDGSIERRKTNVFVFSNAHGVTRNLADEKHLFLSREYSSTSTDPDADLLGVESLVKDQDETLLQLTSDQLKSENNELVPPETISQPLGISTSLPVFAHQGDWHTNALLPEGVPNEVFALIQLVTNGVNNPDLNLTNNKTHTVFEIHFKNRLTVQKYINSITGNVDSETPALPLTHFGNVGGKRKPDVRFIKPELKEGKIMRIVSEIYS